MAANPKAYCHVASQACLNPPGFRRGDGAACTNNLPPSTRWQCPRCGETACRADRAAVRVEGRKAIVWCMECIAEEKRLEQD